MSFIQASRCPICDSVSEPFWQDKRRSYHECLRCRAVHVPPKFHLTHAQEKAEYDKHQNEIEDPGYRRFLSRLSDPLLQLLPEASKGLDFGCGPGPALATMLQECGHEMALYDLYYHPDDRALKQQYDFITATEVVEHLRRPLPVLQQLWSLLNSGGVLGLMTKRVKNRDAFKGWHYKNDPTHIVFFHEQSFHWLANHLGGKLIFPADDVVLLSKPDTDCES